MNTIQARSSNGSSTGLAVVPAPAAPPPPPPPPALRGRSFEDVFHEVEERSMNMLPDQVVRISDLRMTKDGDIALPGAIVYRLWDFARRNLASFLGLRWQVWFNSASPEERAEEVNRRFMRTPGEKKIRAWAEREGTADGVARAFLAPAFTPIDDIRVFLRLRTMLRGLMEEYRFTSVVATESTTHYTAAHVEGFDLDGRGDVLHPGFHLRNSEVGAAALTLDDYWLRLVCTNGLMVRVGGKRAMYRTHRAIEDDALAAALVIAIGRLPERWHLSFEWMRTAKAIVVPHPDDAVESVLGDSPEIPKAMIVAAQQAALMQSDRTRFGVVQAITVTAHEANHNPDVRFAMERLAGDYLAGTPTAAPA